MICDAGIDTHQPGPSMAEMGHLQTPRETMKVVRFRGLGSRPMSAFSA